MKKRIVEIIASIFILLFVYTALSKLYDPEKFKWSLDHSPLIAPIATFVTYFIPIIELFISALLFFPRTRKYGLYSFLTLMGVFTVYIAYMILFAPTLPCSCGGIIQQMTWKQHLVFNVALTLLAGITVYMNGKGDAIKNRAEYPEAKYM